MAVVENRFVCDLSKPVQAQALKGNVFSLDNLGSRISVLIYDNGQPATISGSITANCILPDGSTVNVNGGLTTENGGSKAYVDVPQSCLLIPGILKIAIKCTSSSVITTLAAIVANVYITKTDNVITPSQQIIDDWNAEISAAIATQNATIASQGQQINDISQPSRNLWTFGDQTFTKYKVISNNNNVILPAGTYTISTLIESQATGDSSRISFYDSNNTEITYKTIKRSTTQRWGATVTLSSACYSIWLFSGSSSSGSTGYTATWSDIQIVAGNTATDYVPPISARDTVLQQTVAAQGELIGNTPLPTTAQTITGAVAEHETDIVNLNKNVTGLKVDNNRMLPLAVSIDSLKFIKTGVNLFDYYDPRNVSGYLTSDGSIGNNSSYKTSWFIAVEPNTVYYIGGYAQESDYYYYHGLCEYTEDLAVTYTSLPHTSFTTGATTKYVRFTYNASYASSRVFLSKTALTTGSAPEYSAVINKNYVEDGSGISELKPRYFMLSGDLGSGDYLYDTDYATSIRSNERIAFNADITSFSSLEIGFAWSSTNYKYNRFVIDGTNLTVYDNAGNTNVTAHGLTIENNIQVLVESNFMRTCDITIISNGSLFKATGKQLDKKRVMFPYAQSVGSVLPNAKLSWTCIDFDKQLWIFGDSYVGSYTDKWVKYLYTYGYYENCLFDAFPGETSDNSLMSLQNLLEIAQPKIIVWCLGMNDGGDTNASTPASDWTTAQATLRALCEQKGIELILATIPTVPTINHEGKNTNVRASGYRYIDFAKAVGADSSGHWFGYGTDHDMLSSDGVHPSDYGAKALFGRAVLDVPEMMITP